MKRTIARISLAAACAAVSPAYADIVFNGFGQVVGGSTLGNDHTFPNMSYTADPSFGTESLFALQARAGLADRLSATVQIVASGDEDFQPSFVWAYMNYQIDDHWSLKGGRQRFPLYRYSDYLQVGEAYPWIRPPVAVYDATFENFDGLSLSGEYSFSRWEVRPKLIYGGFQGNVTDKGLTLALDAANLTGAVLEVIYNDWLSFRGWYVVSQNTVHNTEVDQLTGGLEEEGHAALASAVAADGDQARYSGVGVEINHNQILLGGEYLRVVDDNSFVPVVNGYYLLAGRHFGRFMPLLTYGHIENKPNNTSNLSMLSPADPLYSAVTQLVLGSHAIDDYYEAGARYDLSSNTALKIDFTRYESGIAGTPGCDLLSAGFTFNF